MVELAKMILEFLIVYLIVYVCYYFFSYKKIGKYNRNKQPANIKYLTLRYKLDIVKIGYKRICKTLMLCDSLIIALIFSITSFVDNLYIRFLIAFILIFPIFALIYHLVAMYYKQESE